MLRTLDREEDDLVQTSCTNVHERQLELAQVKESLNRLVSIYVGQDIDRETFLAQKETLLCRKKDLQEATEKHETATPHGWLEPFREWIESAQTLGEIAEHGSQKGKKEVASKVFGSNLVLDSKKARGYALKPWSLPLENRQTGGMVGWPGLEPGTNGLKGRCSTD